MKQFTCLIPGGGEGGMGVGGWGWNGVGRGGLGVGVALFPTTLASGWVSPAPAPCPSLGMLLPHLHQSYATSAQVERPRAPPPSLSTCCAVGTLK